MSSEAAHIFYQTIYNDIGVTAGIGIFILALIGIRRIPRRTKPQVQSKVKVRTVSPLNLNPDKVRWWEFWKR